jgi:hypothetical protein
MPQYLDHYMLSTRNIYMSAQKLREETGLGFYDGGYFEANGIANKIFPLGGGTFIEVEGVVDAGLIETNPGTKRFHERTADGECFSLLCMRTDTLDELKATATRLKSTISPNPVQRIRPNGPPVQAHTAPYGPQRDSSRITWYCHEDRQYMHPGGQPVFNWPGCVEPEGISFLEVGGTEAEMTEWIGEPAGHFPYRFNGQPHGLYAIGVKTNKGEVVIRRPWKA